MKNKTLHFIFIALLLSAVNSHAEENNLSFQKMRPLETSVQNERVYLKSDEGHKYRPLKFLPRQGKMYQYIPVDEELRVYSEGFGYAMPFEEEEFAVRRAADDAYFRAVRHTGFPLDDFLADLAGGNKKYLNEPFYGEYLRAWRTAFVFEYKKRPAAVLEWVRDLGYRTKQNMYISFVPVEKKDSSFKIKKAKLTQKKYETGAFLEGSFKASHDCYVIVLRAAENGIAEMMFPYAGDNGFVKKGETVRFSSDGDFIDEDIGKGLVHIIATREAPLKMTADPFSNKEYEDPDNDLNFAESYARGLRDFTRPGWTSVIIPYEVKEYKR